MTLFEIMTVSHNFKTATALAYKRGKLCTYGKYVYNRFSIFSSSSGSGSEVESRRDHQRADDDASMVPQILAGSTPNLQSMEDFCLSANQIHKDFCDPKELANP